MKTFTFKQGQYLAFIHNYTQIHGCPPAESDLQRYFRVAPPTVHRMIVKLHEEGLIERELGVPRSVRVVVPVSQLPPLG